MTDKPIKAVFNPIGDGGGIGPAAMDDEAEAAVEVIHGYNMLEAFVAIYGEVDDFHNINLAIKAFLGVDND